ncbi:integrator complex subunit 6 [Scleropages formosus]|uniref:integrator complex subunit 6 n=1 Tax=Scleropages formosus TaxID=113540 RepID=UPI000878EA75|nr:integrator complex subunit 6-like [Scleropages formosus]
MPVLLFLVDTSASMNQRTHLGTTYLDIAKGAVETFMKLRSRDPASRGDRYMLVSFEETPLGIKAGWKENHATFMMELKNLQAVGLSTVGQALRTSFDLLNLNRLVSGIDNYGQGRNPFFLEPSVIIAITDGGKLTSSSGVQDELHLPLTTPLPGSELTKEPFRWDQRLFALVLRISGHASVEAEPLGGVPSDDSAITPMCEVTGGRSYSVFSQRMLNQCLESLVQKVQSGVVINFEKTGPDPAPLEDGPAEPPKPGPQPWHCSHRLIYVRPNPKTGVPVGHWPIPEAFWPDQNSPTLPPRSAHPHVRFSCVDTEPMVVDKVPFDKYELEPSPLTQYILERKSPHTCWQVFVCNSAKYSDLGQPFGYLKASTALTCVNLFVMPYDYPVLLPLLDDLCKVHKFKPTMKWRQSFENYLKTLPPYYIGPLRKALRMMGAPNLLADNMEYGLSYSVVSYLKKLSQQTKLEAERVLASVGKRPPPEAGVKVRCPPGGLALARHRGDFATLLRGFLGEDRTCPPELSPKDFAGFHLAALSKSVKPQSFRNPYDVSRRHLLDQLSRMRRNLLTATGRFLQTRDQDQLHAVAIAEMGNYQDFLKNVVPPLREADADQPKRLHTFGNPFKLDKKGMMIDEADEFVASPQNKTKRPGDPSMLSGAPKRRRCMSPLLRLGSGYTPPVLMSPAGDRASPAPPSPLPSPPPSPAPAPPAPSAKALPSSRAPEASHGFEDAVLGNHMGDRYNPERAPVSEHDVVNHVAVAEHRRNGGVPSEDGEDGEPAPGDSLPRPSPDRLKKQRSGRDAERDGGVVERNAELRLLINREIRKPGRRYDKIFYFLKQVQGSLNSRLLFLQNIIKEAARFKKRVLIQQLEGFLEEIHTRANQRNHLDGY